MIQIKDFPNYYISETGDIFSNKCNRILSPIHDRYGPVPYLYICLYNGKIKKKYAIHKLVADHFLKTKPFDDAIIRHLDGNSLNNYKDNLAWGSRVDDREDARRNGTLAAGTWHGCAKLTDAQVREIRANPDPPLRVFAEKFGVHISTIQRIKVGSHWKTLHESQVNP